MPKFSDIEVPPVDVEFEVFCSCGNGLCAQSRTSRTRGYLQVSVEPCEKCLDRARAEAANDFVAAVEGT